MLNYNIYIKLILRYNISNIISSKTTIEILKKYFQKEAMYFVKNYCNHSCEKRVKKT